MRNEMNVVIGCDANYVNYAQVMLKSLFESNKRYCINVYVMIEDDLGG